MSLRERKIVGKNHMTRNSNGKPVAVREYRKQYTPEFKQQIVELCKVEGTVKRDIAERYSIPESILYEWIKNYDRYGTLDRKAIREAKLTKVEKLEKRIERLELENSILKDVALILNRNHPKNSDQLSKN